MVSPALSLDETNMPMKKNARSKRGPLAPFLDAVFPRERKTNCSCHKPCKRGLERRPQGARGQGAKRKGFATACDFARGDDDRAPRTRKKKKGNACPDSFVLVRDALPPVVLFLPGFLLLTEPESSSWRKRERESEKGLAFSPPRGETEARAMTKKRANSKQLSRSTTSTNPLSPPPFPPTSPRKLSVSLTHCPPSSSSSSHRIRLRRPARGLPPLLRGSALGQAPADQPHQVPQRLVAQGQGPRRQRHLRRLPRRRRPPQAQLPDGVDLHPPRLGLPELPQGLRRGRPGRADAGDAEVGRGLLHQVPLRLALLRGPGRHRAGRPRLLGPPRGHDDGQAGHRRRARQARVGHRRPDRGGARGHRDGVRARRPGVRDEVRGAREGALRARDEVGGQVLQQPQRE